MMLGIKKPLKPGAEIYPDCIQKVFVIRKKQGSGLALMTSALSSGIEKINAEGFLSNYKAKSYEFEE